MEVIVEALIPYVQSVHQQTEGVESSRKVERIASDLLRMVEAVEFRNFVAVKWKRKAEMVLF